MSDIEDRVRRLEGRVTELEDQVQLYQLMSSYGPLVDSGDAEATALASQLREQLSLEVVLFDPFALVAHATDATDWRLALPVAVAMPEAAEQVAPQSIPAGVELTVPLPGPLHSHRDKLGELADLGYTDIWSAESDGADAFTVSVAL